VSYADLNLVMTGDQKRLVYRVRAAVRDVCQESVGLMPPKFLDQQCRAFAWDGAEPQIDRAIQRAREIAATGSSSIAAGSISISLMK
jgi:UrcA family protein